MINEIFLMNGYGPYVWSAFSFTLLGFASLYLVVKSQLKKQQIRFTKKFGLLSEEKVKSANSQKINKQILDNTIRSKI